MTLADLYSKEVQVQSFKQAEMAKWPPMSQYNMDFFNFKANYRGRYTEKYLTKNGFKPIGDGITYVLRENDFLAHLNSTYDASGTSLVSWKIEIGYLQEIARFWLQSSGHEWSNFNNQLIMEYAGANAEELCCSGAVGIIEPTCCEDDSASGSASGSGSCDGEMPSCKAVYNILIVTFPNLSDDPNVEDDTSIIKIEAYNSLNEDIEPYIVEIQNEFQDLALYSIYKHHPDDDEFYHYIKDRATSDFLFDQIDRTFSAIVPIKEFGELSLDDSKTKRMLRKYGITADDLVESFNKTDDDGEPEVDNAYLMTGMTLRNPYVIEPGTFESAEVQQYPPQLMRKAERNADGSQWTLSEELCQWWYDKNRLRRKKHAVMMFDMLEYYGSGSTNVVMNAAEITINLEMTTETINGVLEGAIRSDGKIRKTYADFLQDETVIVEKPYVYFRPYGKQEDDYGEGGLAQDWIRELIQQQDESYVKDTCTHDYTNEQIEAISGGGTLPVECTVVKVRKQINPGQYKEIVVTSFNNYIKISGHWFKLHQDGSWNSDSDEENSGPAGEKYPRLVNPLEQLNDLDFMTFVIAKEYGTHFMIYSIKVVKTKWYMKWISVVFAVLMCFLPPGAGCALGSLLINIAVSYAVKFVLTSILEMIDSPLLKAIVGIVFTVVMAFVGGDITSMTTVNFLSLASQIGSIAFNAYNQMKMIELKEARELEANIEAGQRIEDGIEAMVATGHIPNVLDTSAHYSFIQSKSPDALYSRTYDGPYSYDSLWDFSGVLDLRVNVVSG